MQIGDKKLVVQRASVGAKPGDMLMDQALEAGLAQPINIPGLCVAGTMQEATQVLCLMNMVTEEELMDDEEYEGECALWVGECACTGICQFWSVVIIMSRQNIHPLFGRYVRDNFDLD